MIMNIDRQLVAALINQDSIVNPIKCMKDATARPYVTPRLTLLSNTEISTGNSYNLSENTCGIVTAVS